MIRFIFIFVALFFTTFSYAQTGKNSFVIPEDKRENPRYSLKQLKNELAYLSKFVGTYPPTVKSKEDKQKLYQRWSEALLDVNAHLKNSGPTEDILSILSELFRLGHNLEVQGSGGLAKESIELCLNKYNDSIDCNFSAIRFYLSIEPTHDNLSAAKRSIDFLVEKYSPEVPPEIVDADDYISSKLRKSQVSASTTSKKVEAIGKKSKTKTSQKTVKRTKQKKGKK